MAKKKINNATKYVDIYSRLYFSEIRCFKKNTANFCLCFDSKSNW